MARLTWSPEALEDIDGICARIASDSELYARIFVQEVVALVEELQTYPRIGRIVPEYQEDNLRERLYQNYRIVYEVFQNRIEIVAVVHGARDFKKIPRR